MLGRKHTGKQEALAIVIVQMPFTKYQQKKLNVFSTRTGALRSVELYLHSEEKLHCPFSTALTYVERLHFGDLHSDLQIFTTLVIFFKMLGLLISCDSIQPLVFYCVHLLLKKKKSQLGQYRKGLGAGAVVDVLLATCHRDSEL